MSETGAYIYRGTVAHRRLRPVGHAFSYRVFSMLLDIDRIDETVAGLKFFSRNRFNLFSFHDRDHGGEDIAARIRGVLKENGFSAAGKILLLAYPRMLGYVFNPLSVYYCQDEKGALEAIIYEVRNTFGGMHSYLIGCNSAAPVIEQQADKVLHVSPFMEMDHTYHFRMTHPGEELVVAINQTDAEGAIFNASFAGKRAAMTDASLLSAFFSYPLMTVKVIAAIHFEAARLFMKGLRLKKAPPAAMAPPEPVSVIRAARPRKAA
ncbi:MAG: DUF1365 domain-containing protein [Parvularculaceae bacterium]